jgi:methylenetetrahydrofolate--tRNA-(uracil-5-)-methyltransferase
MHRNSFLDAPRLLAHDLRLRGLERTWFAGQITGAEGYVEAAACGLIAATAAVRALHGLPPLDVPSETALGAIVAHLQNEQTDDFQPANVTWAYFTPPQARVRSDGRPIRMDKREKRGILAERALERIDAWREALDAPVLTPV